MKIGAQMYTVREYCKELSGLSETLKKIADIGYTTVQISGTCGYEAEWMRDELKKNGLECAVTHNGYDRITGAPEELAADHKTFGCKYIGLGCIQDAPNRTKEEVDAFIAKVKPAAELIANTGCYFTYHNHAFEFEKFDGDKNLLQYLCEAIPAEHMGITLDVHWVKAGDEDPVEYLKLLKGRTPCVHYKDLVYDSDNKSKFAPVGSGLLDFDAIIKASIDLGVEYALVEQDDCYGDDPFVCLKKSYDYLKSMGLN